MTATTSGMEMFVAMINRFYLGTFVTKISLLGVETVPPPEHAGLDGKVFQLSTTPFLKVDIKQHYVLHYFLMSC